MKYRLVLAVLALIIAQPVWADSVNVTAGPTGWSGFEQPGKVGALAYWNNTSYDGGGKCNIGYWLSNTPGCLYSNFYNGSPSVKPDFLGGMATQWDVAKSPTTASVTVTATALQVTDYNKVDTLGWFLIPPANTAPTLIPLFTGLGIPGTSVTFFPTGNYGFYVSSPDGTYLSTGQGDTKSHFAVFQLPGNGHYMLGMEDMWNRSDRDFNDAAFEVQFNEVPEPATMVLLGTGLAGLGAALRRRRQQ